MPYFLQDFHPKFTSHTHTHTHIFLYSAVHLGWDILTTFPGLFCQLDSCWVWSILEELLEELKAAQGSVIVAGICCSGSKWQFQQTRDSTFSSGLGSTKWADLGPITTVFKVQQQEYTLGHFWTLRTSPSPFSFLSSSPIPSPFCSSRLLTNSCFKFTVWNT